MPGYSSWAFFMRQCSASAQDEHDIEPVLADGHGCKDRSHLEENSCLRRRNHDLAASVDHFGKPFIQLDSLLRLAVEKLPLRELTAGMQLVAVGKLATAAWTGPEGFGISRSWLSFPHGVR